MGQKIFEFRGIDKLYVAKVLQDDEIAYKCEAPVQLSAVAEIGKTTESESATSHYDNRPSLIKSSESADKLTLTIAPPELKMLSKIIGRAFDEETGMMIDSPRKNEYFAIMYRAKGTDGAYRYCSRLKGQFTIPEESYKTEDDSTDSNNTQIEFTGIYTEHEFVKGYQEDGVWHKSTSKGVTVDTRYELANVDNFFAAIQTPDTIGTSPAIGTLDVVAVAGSASGKTQIDAVFPASEIGNKLVYKLSSTEESITYDEVLAGWTKLDLDKDITASTGQVINVAEVTTTDNKARKIGYAVAL